MRAVLAGLFLLLLQSVSLAQASGEIEQIGFGGLYRPECWVPMLIRIRSETAAPQSLQIQIRQDDLDRDHIIYTQPIDIGGNAEGSQTIEHYWVYFRPTPNDGGLPAGSVAELAKVLNVNLCNSDGKVVAPIKVTSTVGPVDSPRGGGLGRGPRSTRLVLCVSDTGDSPLYSEYEQAFGILTDVTMVPVKPDELPDDVLGYQAVDAIVWFDADAAKLTEGTKTPVLRAIESYVHQGGQLVVCQPPGLASHIEPFAPMLPIITTDAAGRFSIPVDDRVDCDALRSLATAAPEPPPSTQPLGVPFRTARAVPLSTALVDCWMDWPPDGKGPTRTPYLARIGVGDGMVTWVAQDLGDRIVKRQIPFGWPFIWNRVLDWHDDNMKLVNTTNKDSLERDWYSNSGVDLGGGLQSDLDLGSKTAYLVGVAVLFFLAYWAIAGPGVYLFLLSRRQAEQSWFAFAALGLGATAFTVLVVWAVLRGPPELRHSTLARTGPAEPERIYTRFGLYIPRDNYQTVELRNASDRAASFITPLGVLPGESTNQQLGFTIPKDDTVPVHKLDAKDPLSISVFYRSTLKKLEANWIGFPDDPEKTVAGKARLVDNRPELIGTLTNNTGYDLHDVFFCYRENYISATDLAPTQPKDMVIHVPHWDKDAPLDLTAIQPRTPAPAKKGPGDADILVQDTPQLPTDRPVYGPEAGWSYWAEHGIAGNGGEGFVASDGHAFLLLSLYQRLIPVLLPGDLNNSSQRNELLRHDGRHFDVSNAVAAGRLVILATVPDTAEPAPMLVDGEAPAGTGTLYAQFILPLDRSGLASGIAAPTTQQNLNQINTDIGKMINNGDK